MNWAKLKCFFLGHQWVTEDYVLGVAPVAEPIIVDNLSYDVSGCEMRLQNKRCERCEPDWRSYVGHVNVTHIIRPGTYDA